MKRLVYALIIGFILGIVLVEVTNRSYVVLYTIGFMAIAVYIARVFDARLHTSYIKIILILLIGITLGVTRTLYAYDTLPLQMFDQAVGQKNTFVASIISDIDTRDEYSTFLIQPVVDTVDQKNIPYIQVRGQRIQDYDYGDSVRVTGTLQKIQVKNSNARAYKEKLAREGVYYQVVYPHIETIQKDTQYGMKHFFIAIKEYVQNILQKNIPEPASGLVSGLLIGEKHGLSNEWYARFQSIGMTHVIVLSGYNVTLVFMWTLALLFWLPFRARHALALGSIFVLVCVSGADAPAVRSGILVAIIALATMFGRQTSVSYFLALTIFFMLTYNPFYFLFDLSFQLSIAATYGLVFLSPIIQKYVKRIPAPFSDAARDTTAAQMAVLPLQLFAFGTVSYVALLANTLLLPLVPITMVFGITTFFAAHIFPALGSLFGSVTAIIADVFLWGVALFASLDPIITVHISLTIMLAMYVCVIWYAKRNTTKI